MRADESFVLKVAAILAAVALAASLGSPALAVVRSVPIVGPTGSPVASTEVAVFDEKGEKVGEGRTDDKGVLVYDFPPGRSTVRWQGGSQIVGSGGGLWNPYTIGGAAGLGVVGAAVILTGSGGSGDSGNGAGGPADFAQIAGTYSLSGSRVLDECGGAPQTISNPSVPISTSGTSTVTIHSTALIVGAYAGATGQFSGSGSGYEGGQPVTETFVGTFTNGAGVNAEGVLGFQYPGRGGCLVRYQATYTRR